MVSRNRNRNKKFPNGPIRTCVLCRAKLLKKDLIRFTTVPIVNAGKKGTGRGAYICADHDVGQIEKYKKKLAKALHCDVEALHNHLMGESRS